MRKGITLIALVITIIVLLILAGVTVATLTGENGLLARAQLAKEKNIEAEQDENEKLDSYENEIDNYAINRGNAGTNSVNVIDYSKGEQETGEIWKDGKKVYTQLIEYGNMPNNTTKMIQHNIADVNELWVDLSNSYFYKDTLDERDSFVYSTYISYIGANASNIWIKTVTSDAVNWKAIVCVKYTKVDKTN